MKKKGLIISTVVMVVVLIASLTTATYAWFTVSAKTTIDGFNLKVVSNTAVRIGLRTEITDSTVFDTTDGENLFGNGNSTFSGPDGALTGNWVCENPGLGTAITHNIKFGDVKTAVGVTTAALADGITSGSTTGFADYSKTGSHIFAANGADAKDTTALTGVKAAVVNGSEEENGDPIPGDLAYLWLGITPAGTLQADTNKLYIVVQSKGASVGLGAAIHVAYRLYNPVSGAPAAVWKDEDIFDSIGQAIPKASAVVNKEAASLPAGAVKVPEAVWKMIAEDTNMVKNGDKLEGAAVYVIDLNNYTKDQITQLEMVLYISGKDPDCINSAVKDVEVSIGMYFGAQMVEQPTEG